MISAINEVVGIGTPGSFGHETFCGRRVKFVAPMLAGTGAAIASTHSNRIETRDGLSCGKWSTLSSYRGRRMVQNNWKKRARTIYIVVQLQNFRANLIAL